jgi:hypothetical protein
MRAPIAIVPQSDADARLWNLTREVARLFSGLPWVLIGGQMVAILEAEHGLVAGRATVDVDALLDVRALSHAAMEAARLLQGAEFAVRHEADGLAYRFVRGGDIVDVLAPDHVGRHADLRTVPPDITLEALGGRQALDRRRLVRIDPGDDPFDVPVPSLVGAIVIKARVTAVSPQAEKHRRDLARLLALVKDAPACRAEVSRNERGYLRARGELLDPKHPAWRGVVGSEDGAAALSILAE